MVGEWSGGVEEWWGCGVWVEEGWGSAVVG